MENLDKKEGLVTNSELEQTLEEKGLNPETIETVIGQVEAFTKEGKEIVDNVEVNTAELYKTDDSTELFQDHSNNFSKIRNFFNNDTRRFVAGITMTLLSASGFAKNADNADPELLNTDSIESSISSEESDDSETYKLGGDPDEETEPKKEAKKTDNIESLEKMSIEMIQDFEFEKVKLSPEKYKSAVSKLSDIFSALSHQTKQDIESGKIVIVLSAHRSQVEVVGGGYDAGRGWVNDNLDICEDSIEELHDVTTEASKKSGLSGVQYRYDIPENGVDVNNPDEISSRISFEYTLDSDLETDKSNTIENSNLIIMDMSASMEKEAEAARTTAAEILKDSGKKIDIIKLEGGTREAHANTIFNNLEKVPDGGQLTVFTDEPDSSFGHLFAKGERRKVALIEYKELVNNIVKQAQERNIDVIVRVYNPDEKEGGYKEFSFIDSPESLTPLNKAIITNADERMKTWFNQIPGEQRNS